MRSQKVGGVGGLTRSITHSRVEGSSDDTNVKWLVWRGQTFHMSEMCKC